MELIEISIPFFIGLLLLEILVDWVLRRKYYRLNDTLNNLSLGIMQQVGGIFIQVMLFGWYIYLLDHISLQKLWSVPNIGNQWYWWVICFCLVDLLYYWYHRLSHEMNFLWASHVVHHQSEEYNLAVALRQGTFQVFFTFFFFLPIAFFGFPTDMFVTCYVIGIIYQFWIHTRYIGKLGPIEWIFNTPSHHRVHHGRNPKYIDRNHAGVFIIWDRMFGTFQVEEEEPTYGITKEVKSWNPLWQNLHEYRDFFLDVFRTKKTSDKLKLFVKDPGWFPDDLKQRNAKVFGEVERKKYDPKVSLKTGLYCIAQFVIAMSVFQLSMDFAQKETTTMLQAVSVAFMYILTLTNIGGLLDSRRWAWNLELIRILLVSIIGTLIVIKDGHDWRFAMATVGVLALSLPWLLLIRKEMKVSSPVPSFDNRAHHTGQ